MAKSVIEIEVNDAKFKAFAEAFNKFQASVSDVNKEIKNLGKSTNDTAEKGAKGFAKFRKELEGTYKAAKDTLSPFVKIASVTTQIATSVASTSFHLAKWAAFGAIGSGFGLGALAGSAVATRRTALGYGITPGGLRAARTAYGQFADSDELLSNIAATQFDPTKGAAYSVLGIRNQSQKSPIQLEAEVLRLMGDFWKRNKNNPAALELVSPLASPELGRRLAGLDPGEIEKQIKTQAALQIQYEKNDKGLRDFWQSLQEAGQKIETSLIGGLNRLGPALGKLATTIAGLISKFVESAQFDEVMGKLQNAIIRFVTYLTSDAFLADFEKFKNALRDLADIIFAVASMLKPLIAAPSKVAGGLGTFVKINPFTAPAYWGIKTAEYLGSPLSERNHNPGNLKVPGAKGAVFQQFASDEAGLAAMSRQLSLYYNRDKLDTIQSIISKYAPSSENDVAAYVNAVSKRMNVASGQHLNLNDPSVMSALISGMTKQENSRSNFTPQQIRVVIDNNTSANVHSSAAGLSTVNPQ